MGLTIVVVCLGWFLWFELVFILLHWVLVVGSFMVGLGCWGGLLLVGFGYVLVCCYG